MPHGVPSEVELVAALRAFIEDDLMPGAGGRLGFLARVARNVTAMVERELVLGPIREAHQEARLSRLGMRSDEELATAIRDGQLDDRRAEVIDLAIVDAVEKLSIANPRYVEPRDAGHLLGSTDPGDPPANDKPPKEDR